MNKRIKRLWLKALRSGEYNQTQYALKNGDAFCCLGVLADLFLKEKRKRWTIRLLAFGNLPPEVCRWAGTNECNPIAGNHTLATHNDYGKSFKQIANLIEKHL